MEQDIRIPYKTHPIEATLWEGAVTVKSGGVEIARSDNALALHEADFPIIYYLPREDVDMTAFAVSDLATYCPFKGTATHYSLTVGEDTIANIAWSYEAPFPAVDTIDGYLAFYPNRVEVEATENA
ncbi:MAG: DUF427 domain-containing protein [Alphaproteobacteria bacterium]